MKKKIVVFVMAAAVSLGLTMPVAAAPAGCGGYGGCGRYVDADYDGICDYYTDRSDFCGYYVDENGDGICDHCGIRGGQYVDEDGDGICDNYVGGGNGRGCGRGRGNGRGRGRGRR